MPWPRFWSTPRSRWFAGRWIPRARSSLGRPWRRTRFSSPRAPNALRETHSTYQVGELGIRPYRVEEGIDLQIHQPGGTIFERSLQPVEGLVVLAQADMNDGHPGGLHVGLLGSVRQLLQNLSRFGFLMIHRIGVT